jgi:hypothetical protein
MSTENNLSQPTRPIGGLIVVPVKRIRFGLVVTITGLFIFLVGARPGWFGWDRSPVVGFIQISVFLVGLAIISFGGYISLISFWNNGHRTIAADIGMRLVSTGYVISVFSGMADLFGMGTQVLPQVPFFGHLQSLGVQLGEITIALGFFLMIPFGRFRTSEKSNPSVKS